jgi:hypothetical protein
VTSIKHHYRLQKIFPLDPVLSQMNPVHALNPFSLRPILGSVVGWGTMLQAGRSPGRVPDEVDFSICLILQPHHGPGFDSASNKWIPGIFLGVKSGRRVGLTTLPPSKSRMSENVGALTSHNPKGLHGLTLPLPLPILILSSFLA